MRIDLEEVRRELQTPAVDDRRDWDQIRERLRELVGDSAFEIWLERLELIAVDRAGGLVVAGAIEITSWVRGRFGHALSDCAGLLDREVRLADKSERMAVGQDGERARKRDAIDPMSAISSAVAASRTSDRGSCPRQAGQRPNGQMPATC